MANIQDEVKKLLTVGDTVYSANNGKTMIVKTLDEDGFYTEEDYFFFDECRKLFYLTKLGYERRNSHWTYI